MTVKGKALAEWVVSHPQGDIVLAVNDATALHPVHMFRTHLCRKCNRHLPDAEGLKQLAERVKAS